MIIAIDEAGDFSEKSQLLNIFVAIHIRQTGTILKSIQKRLLKWENSLDDVYRNREGEIKGKLLTDGKLYEIVQRLYRNPRLIGITAVGFSSSDNPMRIIEKHKNVQIAGMGEGIIKYKQVGNEYMAKEVNKMYKWFKKLSYVQYVKIIILGQCIHDALNNSIGVSFVNKFDCELSNLEYKIDEDFLKKEKHKLFWSKLLKDMLLHISRKDPLIVPDIKNREKHPFFGKYEKQTHYDLSEIFSKHLDFFVSAENFEIRIADIIATIYHRYHNHEKRCADAYRIIGKCIWHEKNKPFHKIKLADEGFPVY